MVIQPANSNLAIDQTETARATVPLTLPPYLKTGVVCTKSNPVSQVRLPYISSTKLILKPAPGRSVETLNHKVVNSAVRERYSCQTQTQALPPHTICVPGEVDFDLGVSTEDAETPRVRVAARGDAEREC